MSTLALPPPPTSPIDLLLKKAIKFNNHKYIFECLQRHANINTQSDDKKLTPIMWAIIHNQRRIVGELFEKFSQKIDLELQDKEGNNILILLAKRKYDYWRELVPKSTKEVLNQKNNSGKSLVYYIAQNGNISETIFLLKYKIILDESVLNHLQEKPPRNEKMFDFLADIYLKKELDLIITPRLDF